MADEKRSSTELPPYSTPPEKAVAPAPAGYIKPQARKTHDPDVTFEEYHYYALKTREEERSYTAPNLRWVSRLLRRKEAAAAAEEHNHDATTGLSHELTASDFTSRDHRMEISDEEWTNASRAFRTASWGASFYLITTDILGPYGVGFSLGTLGWGPGIAMYTIFGFMAGYSGWLVWRIFCGVDSFEFPARNYGDLAFRTWGTTTRHITNFIQAFALLLLLGQVILQYGQNISSVSMFRLCYAVCPVLFVIAGFLMTQIRTLKAYGLVANFAVWLNILTIFISMGVIAHSDPNFAIAKLGSAGSSADPTTIAQNPDGSYPAIIHYNNLPPNGLIGSINGILTGVLAYAGVQLFVEFMAEMRRPRDFIKAMWGAQFFIYSVYLIYGCYVYKFQGQYSFNPSYQGVSVYAWQTVGNMLTLIAALIAAGLYGNIGIKVLYNNILMDVFSAPPLITKRGKIFYATLVPIWWSVAYVIAGAIPYFVGFVSVMSASTLLNLTYTLPPLFVLGYDIQKNAIRRDRGEGFDPATGVVTREHSTVKRWARGFVSGGPLQVAMNVWHALYFLASLSMSGLGMYAAVEGMIIAFEQPELNSFSCISPLDL